MTLARIVQGIALTIALGLTIDWPARASGTNDARLTGLRLYAAGQFAEAVPYFNQVLANHKRDLEILIKRGACYLTMDQPEKALADFDLVNQHSAWGSRVVSAGPILTPLSTWWVMPAPDVSFAESWGNRGIALLMLGRDQEALESFRLAVHLWSQPQNQPGAMTSGSRAKILRSKAGAYEGLGQAYHRLGQNELAFQAYTEAMAIDNSDANGFAGRGDVLAALKLLDAAESDYSEAIRLNSAHSRALCGRGIVRSDLGRDEPALADLDRAIAIDTKYAKAYSYRGGLYARRGQNELALADYDALVRLMPDNAGAYKDRGGLLVRMNRFDRAVDRPERSHSARPQRERRPTRTEGRPTTAWASTSGRSTT